MSGGYEKFAFFLLGAGLFEIMSGGYEKLIRSFCLELVSLRL